MIRYAVTWRPDTDNLGDDLRALAASRLLPRVDFSLDADKLDLPIPGLSPEDRVVTLLSGPILQRGTHWPPHASVSPVPVGVHASSEDAWGVPFSALDGAGLAALTACGPIGCRDDRTLALMRPLGISCELTACLTLTLARPDDAEDGDYICCVDVPDAVHAALAEFAPGVGVSLRIMTHRLDGETVDFVKRMKRAGDVLRVYAGAKFVVTRRLHCAMACLAIGTPVLLLYNASYEDVTRFAPMDGMMDVKPVEDFVREVRENGFPVRWENPPGVEAWRETLIARVREGIAAAERRPLPLVPPEEAEAWREERLRLTARSAEAKLRHLEQEHYTALHEKFSLLMREDALKALLTPLLDRPETARAWKKAALRQKLADAAPAEKLRLMTALITKRATPDDPVAKIREALAALGWPDNPV